MKIIIKIILLLTLVIIVFISVRNFSSEKGFVASLDDWLDQFQETSNNASQQRNDDENDAEGDDDDVPSRVEDFQGLPAVRLENDVLERSGIQLATLKVSNYQHEIRTIAKVVDMQDLFQRRTTYQQATFDLNLVSESLRASSRIYERLRVLHKERANISQRQVEEARSRMNAGKTRVTAAKQAIQNIRQQAQLKWGVSLVDAAFKLNENESDNSFQHLLSMRDVLLLVTFPAGLEQNSLIQVNSQPDRATAQAAKFISPALKTNPLSQGLTYYYQARAKHLRMGMNVHVWINGHKKIGVQQGVNIPQNAVIWYGGSAWIYVNVADELYSRRPIKTDQGTDGGWFVQNTFTVNDTVVIKGAQLLLSEELRWQIPDEDDD